MRGKTLARSGLVMIGIGLLTTRIGAQPRSDVRDGAALSRRVRIDFGTGGTVGTFSANKAQDSAAAGVAVDCAMPAIKGDPAIDPQIVKPLPADGVTHMLRVIKVPPCPQQQGPQRAR
jgi:hypothetical protein